MNDDIKVGDYIALLHDVKVIRGHVPRKAVGVVREVMDSVNGSVVKAEFDMAQDIPGAVEPVFVMVHVWHDEYVKVTSRAVPNQVLVPLKEGVNA